MATLSPLPFGAQHEPRPGSWKPAGWRKTHRLETVALELGRTLDLTRSLKSISAWVPLPTIRISLVWALAEPLGFKILPGDANVPLELRMAG